METKDFVLFDADDHVVEPEKIKELKRQPTPLPARSSVSDFWRQVRCRLSAGGSEIRTIGPQ
jgi:hypothetical protein